MEGSCHCGAVRFDVAAAPEWVAECNCSICSKLGTLWAYYSPDRVTWRSSPDQTFTYVWGDRTIAFHTCRTCGCTTHWAALEVDESNRMGVNARLLAGVAPDNVTIRHLENTGHGGFWTKIAADPE